MYPQYTSEQGRSSTDWSIASRQQLARSLVDPFFCELLFDQLADIVFFVKDVQGRYLVVNTTLMRRCGCKEKRDLIGHSPLEVFPPELGASYLVQDRQVVCQGQAIYNRLELHLYNDRSRGWCLTHKLPLLDKDEQIIGVTGISRDLRVPDQGHPVYQRLAEVISYIQKAYAQPIRLEHLAAIANLSVAQLERHIQRIFDLTPKQLLIKTRLEAATRLLEGADSISAIAHACGYADHSAFSRQFRTVVGISPAKYREMLRASS